MHLTLAQWFLFGCVAVSLALMFAAAVRLGVRIATTSAHVTVVNASVAALNLGRLETYVDRMKADFDAMPHLMERADAAVYSMNRSLQEIRLPEAIVALRKAAAAVKLLLGR